MWPCPGKPGLSMTEREIDSRFRGNDIRGAGMTERGNENDRIG